MSYAAHHKDFGSFVGQQASPKGETAAKKIGLVRRTFDVLMQSRQRDVDRQIAHFIAGRAFADDVEREISQRLLTSNWSVNAGAFNYRRFP